MKMKKSVLILVGVVIIVTAGVYCGCRSFFKYIYKSQNDMYAKINEFNQELVKVNFDRDIPLEYKLQIIDQYPDIINTDPNNKFPNSFLEKYLSGWKKSIYENEQQKFYAMAYVGEGLYNGNMEKLNESVEYWNRTQMPDRKRKQLNEFLESARAYIAEMNNGDVRPETRDELSQKETLFFKTR